MTLHCPLLGILAIWGWSLATIAPFFYLVGVAFSRRWGDPRSGLRLNLSGFNHQADPCIHDCLEDPTEEIIKKVGREFQIERQSDSTLLIPGDDEEGRIDEDLTDSSDAPPSSTGHGRKHKANKTRFATRYQNGGFHPFR